MLEKTLESPLENKEIKPINLTENQPCVYTESTDDKAKAPILWPHDPKSWLTGKNPDTGENWRQNKKQETEDKMVR